MSNEKGLFQDFKFTIYSEKYILILLSEKLAIKTKIIFNEGEPTWHQTIQ